MRITFTLLLITSIGCQQQTETPVLTSPHTIDTVGTAPQSPKAPQHQDDQTTPTAPAAAEPALADLAVQPNNPGQSTEKVRSDYDLAIVDEHGNPVSNATIEPISLSINYAKFDADDDGHANIPWRIQPVKWVAITKPGYLDSGHIDVDQPKPITITLKKSTD